jgi:TPR repeat protein
MKDHLRDMRHLAAISTLAGALLLATGAIAQAQPAAQKTEADKPAAKAKPKVQAAPKTPATSPAAPAADAKQAAPAPSAGATPAPAPAADDPNVDLVYGAYQRGQYKTAFDLASARAQAGDAKAMTMLGELHANALGAKRDDAKAVYWYKRAADAGDREAMFALAMMRIGGRGGAADRQEAVKLLASAAKLGEPKAAYNLALLYLDG